MSAVGRCQRRYDSEINCLGRQCSGFETMPGSDRVTNGPQVQCAGKVVPASDWDDEHRKLQTHKRGQVAMDRTIATEDENGIGVG